MALGNETVGAAEPGLYLVVDAIGTILHSGSIRNAPRRFLQPPFLGPRTRAEPVRSPVVELVIEALARNGEVLDAFGWPWTAEAFYDRPLTQGSRGERAGRIKFAQTVRILRIPIPSAGAFLLLSRSELERGRDRTGGAVSRTGLSLYSLAPRPLPRPRLPAFARRLPVRPLPGEVPVRRPR
jgi:hypothetical protein